MHPLPHLHESPPSKRRGTAGSAGARSRKAGSSAAKSAEPTTVEKETEAQLASDRFWDVVYGISIGMGVGVILLVAYEWWVS